MNEKKKNIVYKTVEGSALELDLYLPGMETASALLIYFHGGGWQGGDKSMADMFGLLPRLLEKNIALASVNYRLTSTHDVLLPDIITDCKDSIRFLAGRHVEYMIDPDRLVLWGSSAGAHLALMSGLTSGDDFPGVPELADKWCTIGGIVNWYGITDFLDPGFFLGREESPTLEEKITTLFGAPRTEKAELIRSCSPLYCLNPGAPPILSMHGVDDSVVPASQASLLHKKAEQTGSAHELILVKHAEHSLQVPGEPIRPSRQELENRTFSFICRAADKS